MLAPNKKNRLQHNMDGGFWDCLLTDNSKGFYTRWNRPRAELHTVLVDHS